jgi:hypothetical protein
MLYSDLTDGLNRLAGMTTANFTNEGLKLKKLETSF